MRIGIKIWYNETGGQVLGLTSWESGEAFASMGIGHFVWYPNNSLQRRYGTFGGLIEYIQNHGMTPPPWLIDRGQVIYSPWLTRAEFNAALYSLPMEQLRYFLVLSIPLQARYMVERMEAALPEMLQAAPAYDRDYIRRKFYQIASTPQGVYDLVDYVDFKGLGIGSDAYDGQSWGLLQVLQTMRFAPSYMSTLRAFAWSADQVLIERVENAPPDSDDGRYLVGWRRRVRTYY